MTAAVELTTSEAVEIKRHRFRSEADGRLRAGWRIAAFLAIFYGLTLPLLFGLRALLGFAKSSPMVIVIIAAAALPSVYIARRWIDKKPFTSLGLQSSSMSLPDVIFGFTLSGLMAASAFGTLAFFGFIDNIQVATLDLRALGALSGALAIMALVGFWEELVFRGYVLQNMMEGMVSTRAIAISCVVYGLLHAANPNAGLLSSAIIVLFGYLRIYGFLSSGQLWLSIGMHTGWNFFQATVFGFAASGHVEEWTLLSHEAQAPRWLAGGNFGPEGSVVMIPIVLIALLAMRTWVKVTAAHRSGLTSK